MDALDLVAAEYDRTAWREVPGLVASAYRKVAAEAYAQACGGGTGVVEADGLVIKVAARDFLAPQSKAFDAAQGPLGGPHPLAATIVGGVIGSGLGYGGGYLANRMAPRLPGDAKQLRRTTALAGGLAGAGLGVGWGLTNMANPDATGGGAHAWLSGWPYRSKVASIDAGAFYTPSIPVDAFNNVVWQDVRNAPNRFGTKSPYGDNSQALGTPAPVAAAISGIVAGAGAATDSRWVSPFHVGLTAAASAGKGYMIGTAVGKTLGLLAGLSPEDQKAMQRVGTWGGLMSGIAQSLYGR